VRRLLGIALFAAMAACSGSGGVSDADRRAIESLLAEYARLMAAAYESGDGKSVAPIATEREQQRLAISISELEAEGRALRPTLQSLAIEAIDPSGRRLVTVNTLEVWDLRVVALGTEQPISESLGQENRLTYTLQRDQSGWHVLARYLRSSSEDAGAG